MQSNCEAVDHYAANNPVRYTDPDGREDEDIWFDYDSYCISQWYAAGVKMQIEFDDFKGKVKNFFYNLFIGNVAVGVNVAIKAKADLFSFECGVTMFANGNLDIKVNKTDMSDEFLENIQEKLGFPIIVSDGKVSVNYKIATIEVSSDGEYVSIGLKASFFKKRLGKNLDLSAGLTLEVPVDSGPYPTTGKPDTEMRDKMYLYETLTDPENYFYY